MKEETRIRRIGGYLHRITRVIDSTGKILHTFTVPFQVELKPRDIFQIIVGSYPLAVPVAFTEEVWILSTDLPLPDFLLLSLLSLLFIAGFVYFNFYRFHFQGNILRYVRHGHRLHPVRESSSCSPGR